MYTVVYMYHNFIHSSVDGYLGCFYVLAIVNSAAVNNGMQVSFSFSFFFSFSFSLFQFWFPQDIYLGVELLGHVLVLFLVFFKESPYCLP